ncbi:MAG: hypothetical protein QOJ64_1719 [Acidobacteriota bacterium]|jgi:hypothetical protein|nr:hypothetical protein [Acidobacteriota bacterium]
MNHDPNSDIRFTLLDSRLRGVGGWLALFVVGQVIFRPLATLGEFSRSYELSAEIKQAFPTTATILTVEKILIIHLIVFGIAVGLALWRVRTPFSVTLAKIYLISNPIILALGAVLYYLSDLPEATRDEVVAHGFRQAGIVVLWC